MTTADRKLPPAPPEEQRIPGVRYRTETHDRLVPQTIDGETRMVPEPYEVAVPVPPRDWDHLLLRAVTGTATAVTAVSLVWTTAGIGALLAPVAPAPVAYGAAAIFDTAWLACQAVEWLERYDPHRAKTARTAGCLALLLAVAAILAHGLTSGDPVAGAVGAAVSLIAKSLWVILLRHYAVPLGPRVGGWLLQRRREVAAQRALAAELRRLDAETAYSEAVFGTAARAAVAAAADFGACPATAQEYTGDQSAAPVAAPGTASEKPAYPTARPLPASGRPSIADTIRACLSEGVSSDIEIIARVREVHGDRQNLVDTVARTRRRIDRRIAS